MKRTLAAVLAASIALAPMPALADAYDAAMARAAAAKEKALDANDPASWQEALRLFEEADALRSTKESRYEVATAAAWLKQDDLAVEAYEDAIALGISGPAKAKAEAYVAERGPKMGRLKIVGPEGAWISIEGHVRARLPRGRAIVVFPGKVRLHVERNGATSEVETTCAAGAETVVDLEPKKEAPAPAAPKSEGKDHRALGWTFVASGAALAGLSVYGIVLASSRISRDRDDLQARYNCTLDGDYCQTLTDRNSIAGAQALSDQIATWRAVRTTAYVTGAVGAGLAVTGVVLVLTSKSGGPAVRTEVGALPGGAFFGISGAF
ncbi:MAG: hypothetical protein ACXVEF_28085 [Polyangiales bacterium]